MKDLVKVNTKVIQEKDLRIAQLASVVEADMLNGTQPPSAPATGSAHR
jgi:hypothetical protein